MQQEPANQTDQLNVKTVIAGMILMFIIVHVGFHATYLKHIPEFTGFYYVHHLHGALLASWVFLLVIQPMLIYRKKYATHRLLGKLTYILAPLVIVSMFFIARQNYQSGILKKDYHDVMATQSITWMQLFMFVFFYALAIRFRKRSSWHMRFMIGTAIIMIGPPLNRFLISYFPAMGAATILPLVLYIKTAVAAALLLNDFVKKRDWVPYLIVLLAFVVSDLVFHARYTAAWQGFGDFVVKYLY